MDNFLTADFGSILFQIFIIWLLSSLFSGKKKKTEKKKESFLKPLLKNIFNYLSEIGEKKLAELNIIQNEDEIHPKVINSEAVLKEEAKKDEKPLQKVDSEDLIITKEKRNLKSRLGLNSKSKIKNAIVLNEVLGKPVSLRR